MSELGKLINNYYRTLRYGYRGMKTDPQYKDWTYDEKAERSCTPVKVARYAMFMAAASFLAVLVYGLIIARVYPLYDDIIIALIIISVVSLYTGIVARAKAVACDIRCSECGKDMDYEEVNCPYDLISGFCTTVRGKHGRVYTRSSSSKFDIWYRVMQGIRECKSCKRYIIVNPKLSKEVGKSRAEMKEAEQRAQRIDRARERLSEKKTDK